MSQIDSFRFPIKACYQVISDNSLSSLSVMKQFIDKLKNYRKVKRPMRFKEIHCNVYDKKANSKQLIKPA